MINIQLVIFKLRKNDSKSYNSELTWERSLGTSDLTVLAAAHASANVSIALWKSILLQFTTTSTCRNITQHVPGAAATDSNPTRPTQPTGGALLIRPRPANRPRREKPIPPSLPVSALFFLSRCFNEFLFFPKPSPRWWLGVRDYLHL